MFFQILTNAYVFFPSPLFLYNASLFVYLYISVCIHRPRVCIIYLKSHCLKNWLGSKVALDVNIRGWDKWRDFLQCMHPLLIQSGSPRWRLKSGGNLAKLPTCLPAPQLSWSCGCHTIRRCGFYDEKRQLQASRRSTSCSTSKFYANIQPTLTQAYYLCM